MSVSKAEILRAMKVNRKTADNRYLPHPTKINFTIESSAWIPENEGGGYADIVILGVTANDDAEIDFDDAVDDIVIAAKISGEGDSMENKLRIYAENIPTATITGTAKITKGVSV